ncbi:hypothetical protein EKK97_13900 [Billgrantia tianxiuensis]|uniref:Bacteriophage lambda Replication protein O N-terminal domain-containing protein n=1 Tax=Billgrantia tianxiuensis TaxID=2497861 RepID=A0A6I6SIG5_9GAMM|nr:MULTISPECIES: replication protein [Halomonas]MCE8034591.1 replication protein [Halomonas sp. MCCC 1A11057]QHC50458.1 hypothetical protein EKK97_13900 [Halomonas tianxiuensis]
MSNVAYLPGHEPESVPAETPRGPQVEDGYTRIANELYEVVNNVHTCPVTIRQMRVIHAVIRRTYGFNKSFDRIADTQLAADTGLPRQMVNKAKNELIDMHVLVLDGRKLGINKHYAEWDFSAKPKKKAPAPKQKQNADSVSKMLTQNVSKTETHKRQKDTHMNTYVFIAHRLAPNALVDLRLNHFPIKRPKAPALPNCPHNEIIDLWGEVMPEKPQPAKNLWAGTERARNLAARWKAGFSIKHERTGKPLYTNREEGIAWWGRFFKFLRKSEFLMQDHRWFKLDWVVNKTNFTKIMELSYHEDMAQ